ncbi:MAG: UbiD family decarboxylase [Alphaproteobacteria bacterium]
MHVRELPPFRDLRAFLRHLEGAGQLLRIREPISVVHDMAEIHRRVLRASGPALLFERPLKADGTPSNIPVLVNLFGSLERVAWGLGVTPGNLSRLGEALAEIRDPRPPNGLRDALRKLPLVRAAMAMRPVEVQTDSYITTIGSAVDLGCLPIQVSWPDEPAPLITWPLVITCPPAALPAADSNIGVYRLQVLGRDRAILRWLPQRGGARHHDQWKRLGREMPVAIAIGADPATILAAAMPLPETISELMFSGLLSGERPRVVRGATVPLAVPAEAEIVIEGFVSPTETSLEGPYGDHTGYYSPVEPFPVLRVTAVRMRRDPVYLSTFTGRPPDEPARIGEALNELFVPLVRHQFPEVVDFWLPPDACSYRIAVVSIAKRYPGQARRLMMGLWSMLPQFSFTKLIIVVDRDIDVRQWTDVMWAVSTRSDMSRDLLALDASPVDYLDFASPRPGLGGKLGIDATMKIGMETDRPPGIPLSMDTDVIDRIDALWSTLGITSPAMAK